MAYAFQLRGKAAFCTLFTDFGSATKGLFDSLSGTRMTAAWTNAGAPTDGTGGTLAGYAQPGDLLMDTTNKVVYQNMNTAASPTWRVYGRSVATGLTAAGTTRATALALTSLINVIGTAAASSGVVLPSAASLGIGNDVTIFNDGANAVKVYGAGSDTIDGVAGATGVTLTNANRARYMVTAAATFKSALLG